MNRAPLRRTVSVAVGIATGLTLLLPGLPARAGELRVDDPAGDATAIGDDVESSPRPSDEELDILGVNYSSTSTELSIDLKMAKIGMPAASGGYTYRVNFTHGGTQYQFLYQVLVEPFNQPIFILRSGTTGDEVSCKCSGRVNGKTATLEIRADIASLSRGIRAFDSDAPPIGPGTKFTNLNNSADRVLGLLVAADHANPPPEAVFTV